MPDRTEYYLESLLNDAFKGKGFQKIDEILQEKDIYPPQKYNKQLLSQLDKVLKKELDKNEFPNVSLLLKCIQLYCRSDPQEGMNLLLQQGLVSKISSLTRAYQIIGKSNAEGKKQLLESFIPYLGQLATESNVNCGLRQEALRTLNTLLDNVAREERKKLAGSEEMCLLTKELAKAILDVGDYDIQVAIVEAVFRLMLKKWRDDLVHNWFEDQHIAKAFREIKDRDFETDCRKFLNEVNERLGDKRRVCSIPCKAAEADMNKLKKPADDKLEEFWIDFNFGSESVTFYLESTEGALWESVRLPKDEVSSYYLQEEGGEKILKMFMKNPTTINRKEATKIKIHFDSQFDISTLVGKVLGKDKMMIMLDKEDSYSRDQPQQNKTVAGSHLDNRIDSAGVDSLSDILSSQLSEQSIATPNSITPTNTTTSLTQETEGEHDHLGQASIDVAAVSLKYPADGLEVPPPLLNSASTLKISPLKQKDKTVEPSVEESDLQAPEAPILEDDALEKRNEAKCSSKQITEAEKDAYEFENTSDPVAHEMVAEMKKKVFAQMTQSHRSSKSSKKRNMELSNSERRLSASYKKHLFSESNHETPSNSASEKSWILDSQIKAAPKPVDYTRKKPRVRSNLKVLPLSSPSSGNDRRATKARSSAAHKEKAKRRMKPNTVKQTGITSTPLSQIGQKTLLLSDDLEMADATLPLSDISSPNYTNADLSKNYEAASSTLPLEDTISKTKRKLSDFSACLPRKRSKLTERKPNKDESPSISFEPKKLFNSTTMEEETQKELEDDVFVSKILTEELSDPGVITAFENFTNELKKSFWSRYKSMEIYIQNILKAPEQNISALLNLIHQCRLNELENFRKIVVQELASLEKRTLFLSSLEKDTVEFWTKQSNKLNSKLNSFCSLQMQRIQSMDSVLDETTRNFKDTGQTVEFRNSVDHNEERSKAFVDASD